MIPWHLIVVALLGIGLYALGRYDGTRINEAKHLQTARVADEVFDAAQAGAAKAIAKIEVKNVTVKSEIQREIVENVVYRDCRHTPDGLRSLNAALTGANTASRIELPVTDPAH